MLNVTLGASQRHRSLTVFPLLASDAPELPYSLMADALGDGLLRIAEIGAGTVPELLAVNAGKESILVLDGEQLVGAKQNRTTNRSLLLPPHSETRIPVSCMEQGRWHVDSDHFQPTEHSSPAKVRRQAREVEARYARGGLAASPGTLAEAQGSVWNAIADHSAKVGAHPGTGALDDLYRSRADDLERWVDAFPPVADQVGVLAFLGARPLGLDLIGSRALFARLHGRLLRGYLMDALGSRARARVVEPSTAQEYLARVTHAARVDSPTVGSGSYAVLDGEVIGGELTAEGHVVHLSAFPAATRPDDRAINYLTERPIAPPSRRRRVE